MLKNLGAPLIFPLDKALDASWLRQQVIANNIANVDTPGYKRWDVSFEKQLEKVVGDNKKISLNRTHPKHFALSANLADIEPQLVEDSGHSLRNDGNNVDIDAEMARQAANSLNYQMLTRMVTDYLEMLKIVAREGR